MVSTRSGRETTSPAASEDIGRTRTVARAPTRTPSKPGSSRDKPTLVRRSAPPTRNPSIPDHAHRSFTSFTPSQRRLAITQLHALLSRTTYPATICPSQLARRLPDAHPDEFPPGSRKKGEEGWRGLMEPVRGVVWECVKAEWVEVCQGGEERRWEGREDVRGPIRVRKGKKWDAWKV